jgi:hypothetical protein
VYELTMRNCAPINRMTSPMKKYWLRFSSIVGRFAETTRSAHAHKALRALPIEALLVLSSANEFACSGGGELPM